MGDEGRQQQPEDVQGVAVGSGEYIDEIRFENANLIFFFRLLFFTSYQVNTNPIGLWRHVGPWCSSSSLSREWAWHLSL